jgi:hypothetical protein
VHEDECGFWGVSGDIKLSEKALSSSEMVLGC